MPVDTIVGQEVLVINEAYLAGFQTIEDMQSAIRQGIKDYNEIHLVRPPTALMSFYTDARSYVCGAALRIRNGHLIVPPKGPDYKIVKRLLGAGAVPEENGFRIRRRTHVGAPSAFSH